jgi:hypothetical protein
LEGGRAPRGGDGRSSAAGVGREQGTWRAAGVGREQGTGKARGEGGGTACRPHRLRRPPPVGEAREAGDRASENHRWGGGVGGRWR